MNITKLKNELEADEGRRYAPYPDQYGYWTIGIGHKMSKSEKDKIKRVNDAWIELTLEADVQGAIMGCHRVFGAAFLDYSDNRQRAFANMVFQMGEAKVRKFERMVKYALQNDWHGVAHECLDSKYAKVDTPKRAQRIATMLREG